MSVDAADNNAFPSLGTVSASVIIYRVEDDHDDENIRLDDCSCRIIRSGNYS